MTPEGKVKEKVKRLLAKYKNVDIDMPVPNGFGRWGLDFHCVYRGIPFAIETKAHKKKPTARQEGTIASKRRAGTHVFVVVGVHDPVFDKLKGFLDIITKSTEPTLGCLYYVVGADE